MKVVLKKRIYTYILQTFIPLLLMTFVICWFVVLMQFLWKYVDEMVGKGLSMDVLMQFMFYAALSLVNLALPLGILLGSLMTFGNLGERLELLAMKSSGLPLYKIMYPIFVAVLTAALGLFIFQNDLMIKSQVKMFTILLSARNSAPELEIPEGTFYSGIKGYNIFVKQKDKKNGLLKEVLIYDHSQGFENTRIIAADSARLVMDASKQFLTLSLFSGQSFYNLKSQDFSTISNDPSSFAKERFTKKQIVIAFDANFKMIDENELKSQYVGKNLFQLQHYADSVSVIADSVSTANSQAISAIQFAGRYSSSMPYESDTTTTAKQYRQKILAIDNKKSYPLDTLAKASNYEDSTSAIANAISRVELLESELNNRKYLQDEENYKYRINTIEWHRKFTFPVACIVFFFIGAPLGAIIRKGGLGTPIVASVVLFIIYYMIDTFGFKMARSGEINIALGMWLSTLILLPLGFFLTYKATKDSASLNTDAYANFFKKLFGRKAVRKVEFKEVIMVYADEEKALADIAQLQSDIKRYMQLPLISQSAFKIPLHSEYNYTISEIRTKVEAIIDDLRNSANTLIIVKLMDIPLFPQKLSMWIPQNKILSKVLWVIVPISLPLSIYFAHKRKHIVRDLNVLTNVLEEIKAIINNDKKI
ncbi:LptF/LptG family permease [Porphyromonas pogonae]|uniref:LptF/LptG family permease n=1 Tax=Porphyromonas pogonae TaxID=867595 RepID=UPI002E771342|nr:LptF/LptG family permease [Porphyromonas pogonae]